MCVCVHGRGSRLCIQGIKLYPHQIRLNSRKLKILNGLYFVDSYFVNSVQKMNGTHNLYIRQYDKCSYIAVKKKNRISFIRDL